MNIDDIVIRIAADVTRARRDLRDLDGSLGSTAGAAAKLGKAMAALAVAALGGSVLSDLVRIKDEAIRLEAAYKMIFGTTERAADSLRFVTDVANTAGVALGETAKSFQSIAAAAKGTALEGQATRDIFETVTLTMAKLGKDSNDTAGALKALEQMISKGKVQAEELRGQLGERLPGAFSITARAMGVTSFELSKMMELGQVTAEEMLPKLRNELEKMYGSSEVAQTVTAEFERLKNAFAGPDGLGVAINNFLQINDKAIRSLAVMGDLANAVADRLNNTISGSVGPDLGRWSEEYERTSIKVVQLKTELESLNSIQGTPQWLNMREIPQQIEAIKERLASLMAYKKQLFEMGAEERWNVIPTAESDAANDRKLAAYMKLRNEYDKDAKATAEIAANEKILTDALTGGVPAAEVSALRAKMIAAEREKAAKATESLSKAQSDANKTATDMIKQFEGLNLSAYLDQAGVSTIGYGHTGPEIQMGLRIDMDQAETYLKQDVAKFEETVRRVVTVSLTDNQAAALTSLAYNIGEGAFKDSTLVKLLNAGDYQAAAEQFDAWTKVTVNGLKQTSDGLVKRRDLEQAVFRGSTSLADATSDIAKAEDDARKKTEAYNDVQDQARKIRADVIQQIHDLSAAYKTDLSASRLYADRLNEIRLLHAAGEFSMREHTDALRDARLEYQATQGPMAEYLAGLEKNMGSLETLAVDAMDGFRNAIVDGLMKGEMDFDDFVDTIKRKLIEMAVDTIILNFAGNILGVSGGGSVAGAATTAGVNALTGGTGASSAGTLASLYNMIGGNSIGTTAGRWASGLSAGQAGPLTQTGASLAAVPNWAYGIGGLAGSYIGSQMFEGQYVGIGSGIGSSLGTMGGAALAGYAVGGVGAAGGAAMGATYGSVIPIIGTIIGGILGGILGAYGGSLFGDSAPRQGNFATSFSGLGMEDNAKAQGAFGLSFGLQDKGSSNIDAANYQSTFDGMATVSKAISQFYGTELSNTVQTALRDRLGDFNGWGKDVDESFENMFQAVLDTASQAEGDVGDGMGHLLRVAVGDLDGTAQEMAIKIEAGMATVKTAVGLFGTDIGKLLGFGTDEAFSTLEQSVAGLTGYINDFKYGSETATETLTRLLASVGAFTTALALTGTALDDITLSARELIVASQQFVDIMGYYGFTLESLASTQSAYYDYFFTAEEKAAKQRDAALVAIGAFNDSLGLTGDAAIDTASEFRAYMEQVTEGLKSGSAGADDIYFSALQMVGSFISLDQALQALSGTASDTTAFIDSLQPKETGGAALQDLQAAFADWGVEMPKTTGELYALIQAGKLTDDQIAALANRADDLTSAFAQLETMTSFVDSLAPASDQVQRLVDTFNAWGIAIPKTADELYALIQAGAFTTDQLAGLSNNQSELTAAFAAIAGVTAEDAQAAAAAYRAAYDAQVEALNTAYQTLTDSLNAQVTDANTALSKFEGVISSTTDALRGLTESTDQLDQTRQRALYDALSAINQFNLTGVLPDSIDSIVGNLGSVNPNDFATKEQWLAAVGENKTMLQRLQEIGVNGKTAARRQLDALEQLISQAKTQHDAALAAAKTALDAQLAADKTNTNDIIRAILTQANAFVSNGTTPGTTPGDTTNTPPGTPDVTDLRQNPIMADLVDSLGINARQAIMRQIIALVGNNGAQPVDTTVDSYTDNYDYIVKLLGQFSQQGIYDNNDATSIELLLKNFGIVIDNLRELTKNAANPLSPTNPGTVTIDSIDDLPGVGRMFETMNQTLLANFNAIVDRMGTTDTNSNGTSDRAETWASIQNLVSNNGQKDLPIPDINYGTDYQKAAALITSWKAQGLFDNTDQADISALLAQFGVRIPGFAAGGTHTGGLRIVGEDGPEIEYTGPSSITPNNNLGSVLSEGNAGVIEELKELRRELAELRGVTLTQSGNTATSTAILKRWNGEGLPPDRNDYLKTISDAQAA